MIFVYTCLNLMIPVANDKICCLFNFIIKLSKGKKEKKIFFAVFLLSHSAGLLILVQLVAQLSGILKSYRGHSS